MNGVVSHATGRGSERLESLQVHAGAEARAEDLEPDEVGVAPAGEENSGERARPRGSRLRGSLRGILERGHRVPAEG